MNDFNDDYDNIYDDNFDDFNQSNSLKDVWQNNPLLKLFVIIAGIVLLVSAVFIFSGRDTEQDSRIDRGIDESEAPGGNLSQSYADAIINTNEQGLEDAIRRGESEIPIPFNLEQQELLTESEELPPYQEFDPLTTFRNAIAPQEPEVLEQQPPVLVAPEQVFTPQAIQQQQAPAASPEAIQALAQAMSAAAGNILSNHDPLNPQITQVTPENFLDTSFVDGNSNNGQLIDTNGDGIPDTPLGGYNNDDFGDLSNEIDDVIVETILIPSGTINYAQILIEANSDVRGPVLAQLVSGPLSGARLIGSFTVNQKVLVLSFNSIVIDGINQPISAIAIDPNTTLPGVATDVNNRYFQRVILPAAARFIEGVGSAIAQDTQTTVTVSGDTVIEQQDALDLEQEIGAGVAEGFEEVADFIEEEADQVERLVRVRRGTPVGIFFTQPVLEIQ